MGMTKAQFESWSDEMVAAMQDVIDKQAIVGAAQVGFLEHQGELAAAVADVENAGSAVSVLAGTFIDAFADPIEVTPPYIVSISPADGALEVDSNATVSVTFSDEMDTDSVTETSILLVDEDGVPMAPSQTDPPDGEPDKKTFVLQLSGALTKEATYFVRVTNANLDTNGNQLNETYTQTTGFVVAA